MEIALREAIFPPIFQTRPYSDEKLNVLARRIRRREEKERERDKIHRDEFEESVSRTGKRDNGGEEVVEEGE